MAGMTATERLETAIRLGKPDRVPVIPMYDFFASRYGGITQHQMFFDIKKADMALGKTISDLGPIDGQHLSYAGIGRIMGIIFPQPPVMPGINGVPDDAQFQFVEKSIIGSDDYRRLEERNPFLWMFDTLKLNHPQLRNPFGFLKAMSAIAADALKMRRSRTAWLKKDVETTVAYNITFTPMEWISICLRSFSDLVLDLFRHPEEVKAASRSLMTPLKMQGMLMVKLSGLKRVFMGGARTSAGCISPKQFEEFALPEWQEMVEYFVGKGVTPFLHLDSEWTPFFPYLKSLPARKCVLNLDGTSDIYKAKEVLGDHFCIMGDVPATLLRLGEPDEVDGYCRRLITEVGADGGFILSSGCTLPIDARPENVKAMLGSVHRYGKYPIRP
jgi:hypothetical protein